jgi:predicted ATP-grasp superfamily ATP-dependent carboligase
MKKVPAIITPLDEHMGLDIARSLARHNIPVFGIDSESHIPGQYSKYCEYIQCPSPKNENNSDYVQFLIELGRAFDRKPVLYPLSDMHVLICSKHREILQEYYHYVMPEKTTVERLTTKDGLQAVAEENGVLSPKTIFVNDANDISRIIQELEFPVILKPTESTYWHDPEITKLLRKGFFEGRAKVIYCENPSELQNAFDTISQYDDRLVVQEVIPGEDSRLVYISFYLNRQSQLLGIFAGRKCRVIPTGFGSASYVRSYFCEELMETAMTILNATHYQGLGGIEFKKDPRDEQYKLIEFNTRFGMWDGLSVRCGVDLPYISYCDALGLEVCPGFKYRENVIWIDWQRDVRAVIEYWRKGQISLHEWLCSLQGEKMWAIYSADDWRPGAVFTYGLFTKMVERIRK